MSSLFRDFFKSIGIFFCILFVLGLLVSFFFVKNFDSVKSNPKKDAILHMKFRGIVFEPYKFLKDLRKYSRDDDIRGVIVEINSPGGAVGPSQEIYQELEYISKDLKKPVVVVSSDLLASGAYYIAVGADHIFVNPGTLVGSIGVIMEFLDLQELYKWSRISRFSIKTGEYKDTGSSYRKMRENEKALLQALLDDVLDQFVDAVTKGRKLKSEFVREQADGRIFTGRQALELGLVDELGGFTDAVKVAGEMTNLGDDPPLFVPPREIRSTLELLGYIDSSTRDFFDFKKELKKFLRLNTIGQPLYLMPGVSLGNY